MNELHGEADFKWLSNANLSPSVFRQPANTIDVLQLYKLYVIPTLANTEVGLRSDILGFRYTG